MSTLFTKRNGLDDIMKVFRDDYAQQNPVDKLGRMSFTNSMNILMTKDEIVRSYGQTEADIKAFVQKHVTNIDSICGIDKKGVSYINADYAYPSLLNALTQPEYDLLAITRDATILSFIIAQKGECHEYKDSWCVNLICTVLLPGSGSLLLNAVSYCVKKEADRLGIRNPVVLLELANIYDNPQGLLSYARAGYVKDMSLYYYQQDCTNRRRANETVEEFNARATDAIKKRRCFCDNTIPMKANLADLTYELIISFMKRGRMAEDKVRLADDSGILDSAIDYPVRNLSEDQLKITTPHIEKCQKDANKYLYAQQKLRQLQERKYPSKKEIADTEQDIIKQRDVVTKCLKEYGTLYNSVTGRKSQQDDEKKDASVYAAASVAAASIASAIQDAENNLNQMQRAVDVASSNLQNARQEQARLTMELRPRKNKQMSGTLSPRYSGQCGAGRQSPRYSGQCGAGRQSPSRMTGILSSHRRPMSPMDRYRVSPMDRYRVSPMDRYRVSPGRRVSPHHRLSPRRMKYEF
jgi:predicted transcriptional regulator